ncbi:MAG: hypothetical protein U9Q82_10580, partial [Chloroflexota bacterium]|nr:hypothetical protein [Chloroflexota bacterium]
ASRSMPWYCGGTLHHLQRDHYRFLLSSNSNMILCRWSRTVVNLVMTALIVLTGAVLSGCLRSSASPELIIDKSVASDFKALAEDTWEQFLVKFQARKDCFGDVHLKAAYSLDNKAIYDPDSATVTIRVPASAAFLQSALVHEWAHHIEFQCAEHEELRPDFLAALELSPDTLWRSAINVEDISMKAWKEIPSEQYAEATVIFVLGRQQIPSQVRVGDDAVSVVAQWALGVKHLSPTVESRGD